MTDTYDRPSIAKIDLDDIAQLRHHINTHSATCANSCALIERMLEDYEHAVCAEGDHLSIASRRMVDTVMDDRDALRQRVRDLESACRCAAIALRMHDQNSPTAKETDLVADRGLR